MENTPEIIPEKEEAFKKDKKIFALYEKLRAKYRFVGNKGKISGYLFFLPDFIILLGRLGLDKRVPYKSKALISAVVAYLLLPIDIIPDFIPVVGYIDDLVLVTWALHHLLNQIDYRIVKEHWSGEEDLLNLLRKITALAEEKLDKTVLKKIKDWLSKAL